MTKEYIHAGAWIYIGLIPTFWSAIALIAPLGSALWWHNRAGGRDPSSREQLAYQDAIELLQANSEEPLPRPGHWFVIDTPQPDAAVVGSALMLSRGLLETEHLPAVLAHELGHLATPDGRLTGGGGHHRCPSCVDGGDDLLGIDALEVDRCRSQVCMAELALDDVQRYALPRELKGVGMA